MKKYLYKFLNAGLKSAHDGSAWTIGEWREVEAPEKECVGLNASVYVQDALGYVQGPVLAKVECGGKILKGSDKWTCERMRIVEVADWGWRESVGMAVYAARSVLPAWEKAYPDDNLVLKAIEAAEAVLVDSNEKTRDAASYAAWAASAASAAASAASAAASYAASAAASAAASYAASAAASYAASAAASAAASYAASYAASAARAASAAASAARAAASAARAAASAARAAASAARAARAKIHNHALSLVTWRKA